MDRPLEGQSVLVVGPGWLGATAAQALCDQGAAVWTLQRGTSVPRSDQGSGRASATLPIALTGDIRASDEQPWHHALPSRLDATVVCIAPSRSRGDSHESTYPASLEATMLLATTRSCRTLVYTSSTGVYGRTDGGISRETDIISPADAKQGALFAAEAALCAPSQPTSTTRTILRVAGLYGPGRDPAARFAAGMPSAADDVWCNFSWRDDVVSAIARCVADVRNTSPIRLFNCADGHPIRASTVARALGATPSAAPPPASAASGRGRSNQQIFVEPLRATGWRPAMTSVFDGLRALGHAVTFTNAESSE